jgi:serine/threonine protein kinase
MTMTPTQVWQALQDRGLATAIDCRRWATELLELGGESALDSASRVLSGLVKLGHVTQFQSETIFDQAAIVLRRGRFRLLAPVLVAGFPDWYEAEEDEGQSLVWLYVLEAERLRGGEFARNPPSLRLAGRQAATSGDHLQSFTPPEWIGNALVIAGSRPFGQPLKELLEATKRLAPEVAFRLVRALTRGLAELHAQRLVHGEVGVDRVWWDGSDRVTLLRQPLFPPVSPRDALIPGAATSSELVEAGLRYAAPEFSAPGQSPTPATDIYALGCLWWELLNGRAPHAEQTLGQLSQGASRTPLALPERLKDKEQRQCLRHMLAMNPTARFADGGRLLQALEAIAEPAAVAGKPVGYTRGKEVESRAALSVRESAVEAWGTPPPRQDKPSPDKSDEATLPSESGFPSAIPRVDTGKGSPLTVGKAGMLPGSTPPKTEAASSAPNSPTSLPAVVPSAALASTPPASRTSPSPSLLPPVAPVERVLEPPSMPAAPVSPVLPSPVTGLPSEAKASSYPGRTLPAEARKAGERSPRKPSAKKGKRPVWLLPAMLGGCILLLLGLVGLLSLNSSGKSTTAAVSSPVVGAVSPPQSAGKPESVAIPAAGGQEVSGATKPRAMSALEEQFTLASTDDGLPWLPPRASRPYALTMLPPGAHGFLFVKPMAWSSSVSGRALTEVLSVELENLSAAYRKFTSLPWSELQQGTIGLYPGGSDGLLQVVYRIQLKSPATADEIAGAFQGAKPQSFGEGETVWVDADLAAYIQPPSGGAESKVDTFTIGPLSLIQDLASARGGAGPLRRQMEQLWQVSDAEADFSALLAVGPFFSDARNVLPQISQRAQALAKALFDEKAQAVLVSTTLEPEWYIELRMMGDNVESATNFITDLQERMKALADRVEAELVANPAESYWRALAVRFPQMLRALAKYQRYALENGQAITNAYLPSSAAANLMIAGWMALKAEFADQSQSGVVAATPDKTSLKVAGDALLDFSVSIGFDQEPLDLGLAAIAQEVQAALPPGSPAVEISIDGKAFELAGVTRNQQLRDFRFQNAPLRKLLNDIASRLNPDRTVTDLSQAKQVVVWWLEADAANSRIVFSSRPAANQAKRALPAEFGTSSN